MIKITDEAKRLTLMTLSGLLFVGATASWHALGYLNHFAWVLEWGNLMLAFVCIFLSLKSSKITGNTILFTITALSLVFSSISYYVAIGYTNLIAFYPIYYLVYSLPAITILTILRLHSKSKGNLKQISLAFMLTVLASSMLIAFLFYRSAPIFPTDEAVIDLYSAHLFINGLNPYNPSLVANAFAYFNYPLYANTPFTTGGYVKTLTYPALSFLILVPAQLLNVKASTVMLPFFVIPIILTWYMAWKNGKFLTSSFILLPFLSLTIYASQVVFSDLDIVWTSLLMLSYYVLPKTKLSGFLFGLSLSVKQFPAIVLPFFIVFLVKEFGWKKSILWFTMGIVAFTLINGYFMALGFGNFMNAIIENEFAPLLGVGFGFSQLSFLGYLTIPRIYFAIIMVALFFVVITFYILWYQDLKYLLFVFPIIIFLFNYRLFIQYVMYWMILSLMPLVDLLLIQDQEINNSKNRRHITVGIPPLKRKKLFATCITGIILGGAVLAGYTLGAQNNQGTFTINEISATQLNSSGYIDAMNVIITFNGHNVDQTPVFFRFFIPGQIDNVNMLLWEPSANVTLHTGITQEILIKPQFAQFALPSNTTYRVIAYYGDIQGSYESVS